MKPHSSFLLLAALLALSVFTCRAADSGGTFGTVHGRVQNVVTGQYLSNARVSVQGTTLSNLTDESGTFRITQVPAGAVILEVFYTGLDPLRVPVQVASGEIIVQDVGLTNVARYGNTQSTVKLDPYIVSTARDTDAESIAINEQRFAPNLKTVVSTEAFGDVTDGNVGEFLKFMPGITTLLDDNEGGTVTTVSIRGFPSNLTNVSSDGSQLANTGSAAGNTRTFFFGQVSTNNLARVEVTKSPTPATPADTMAGFVNLVSKSAFERKDAKFTYNLSLSGTTLDFSLKREPFPGDKMIYKVRPGFTFDYTLPVTRDFGIVVTGQNIERYIHTDFNFLTYSNAAAAGASLSNPFLQGTRIVPTPRLSTRRSLGVRADWRVTPNSVLALGFQTSSFLNTRSPVDFVFDTGTNPAPTVSGGKSLTFGPSFTSGATGRGTVSTISAVNFQQPGRTRAGNLRYRFDDGTWKIEAVADYSVSVGALRDINASPGRFRNLNVSFAFPVRVEFSDMGEVGPRSIRLFDNNEREVSMFDVRNYRIVSAVNTNRDFTDEFASGKFDVRRRFKSFPFPVSLQAGGARRVQTRDIRRYSSTWNYTGPGDLSYLLHEKYKTTTDDRFNDMQWLSNIKSWAAYEADPSIFTQTAAQALATASFTITNSEYIRETVDALYAQVEFQPVQRLTVLTGVRRETTDVFGLGPLIDPTAVWVRNADGSFARTPAGARIRKTEAGTAGSFQELALVRQERGARANRKYDGYYPSLHATYNIGANFLARASFAKTYGRPNFTEIIPNTSIGELDTNNDPNSLDGRISVRNPGLIPWSAKNYDISLEYYTSHGGLFSIGAFRKDVSDFFVDSTRIATAEDLEELQLDPQYIGWEIDTRANGGTARTDGIEFSVQHSLQPLGKWGRPFQVFINGSKLTVSGAERDSFTGFVPKSLNWGFTYNQKRLKVTTRWNFRGKRLQSVVAALGPNGAQYFSASTTMDLNVDFRLTPRLALFSNFQNVLGETEKLERYGDETPGYARFTKDTDSGTFLTFGVKGSF
jgi:iron complex outermembrane recepter protein